MPIEMWTITLFVCLFILVFAGLPVAFALGGTAMLFTLIFWGPQGLYMAAAQAWGPSNQFVLVAIPLGRACGRHGRYLYNFCRHVRN